MPSGEGSSAASATAAGTAMITTARNAIGSRRKHPLPHDDLDNDLEPTQTQALHDCDFPPREQDPQRQLRPRCPFRPPPFVSGANIPQKEEAVKYMLLIHQGEAPTPRSPEDWARLSEEEQRQVFADYQAVSQAPGVEPGLQLEDPEAATTVRVERGETLVTDGPYATVKEALGGWLFFEADDLDAAIELAARIPAARLGGGIEIRPIVGG